MSQNRIVWAIKRPPGHIGKERYPTKREAICHCVRHFGFYHVSAALKFWKKDFCPRGFRVVKIREEIVSEQK